VSGGKAGCGPKVLVAIGPLFMLIGAGLGIYALVTGGRSVADTVGDFLELRDDLVAEVDPPDRREVALEAGDYTVFAIGDALVVEGVDGSAEAAAFEEPTFSLTSEDGTAVALDTGSFSSSYVVDVPDAQAVGMATLTVDRAGTYVFEVGPGDSRIDTVGLAEGTFVSDAKDALLDLGPAAIWAVLGAFSFGFGVLLLVIGVVWWVVSSRRAGGGRPGGGFGGVGGLGFTGGNRGGFGIQGRPWSQ
jgi:hypothetical protein